ncbi:hypothetical protein FB192DRAFT_1400683 [Mucor lusitanicus]|uniref:Uncharacterized protein n=1 Tax=Mucor circinelloides f. lusitanicus TaxID=29924 RepID=A0A8H4B8F6_MUCCL|nr:hypothetical protein FB192DRAFT_1400643 [Mucor lusitanicus]KAF1797595.1 hypothetical protein FB192DRAFT_1400683 [Mucor lusitanicus]
MYVPAVSSIKTQRCVTLFAHTTVMIRVVWIWQIYTISEFFQFWQCHSMYYEKMCTVSAFVRVRLFTSTAVIIGIVNIWYA